MVAFEIRNKVALITGGASGLGFQYAVELLKKGARGVTLADINSELGSKSIKELEIKYGKSKVIFVTTDVTDYEQFENAFKKTVETFKNVDILINNAGAMNDAAWQKANAVNLNGTIHGILLGLENYLPKHRSGSEAIIVNISSVAGVCPFATMPIYTGTKFAVHGMTLAWGLPAHYDRTKVKVLGVCPGATSTPLLAGVPNGTLGPAYNKIREIEMDLGLSLQTTEQVAPGVIQIIEKAPSGTMWVIEDGQLPYKYEIPDRFKIPKLYLK